MFKPSGLTQMTAVEGLGSRAVRCAAMSRI